MFLPPKVGAVLNLVLPKGMIRALHRVYDPYHQWAVQRLSRRLIPLMFPDGSLSVQRGPFSGMKYVPQSGGSALVPKLLGSYEMELHPHLLRALERKYETVVDIGCAEGYYTVGMALRMPEAVVHGFDLVPKSLDACKRLAELNGVADRVRLNGGASVANLRPLVSPTTLIISDCEGCEVDLLDPAKIPALRYADMLIELHDRIIPGASETIKQRFASTHEVTIIPSTERNPEQFPELATLSPKEQRQALDEFRGGPMDWAYIRHKSE